MFAGTARRVESVEIQETAGIASARIKSVGPRIQNALVAAIGMVATAAVGYFAQVAPLKATNTANREAGWHDSDQLRICNERVDKFFTHMEEEH